MAFRAQVPNRYGYCLGHRKCPAICLAAASEYLVTDTPCVGICAIDARSGLCQGCARTLAEIASWPTLSASERRQIMRELAVRKASFLGAAP
ncbi:MAG: DUF1289 domain-containing protein [Proteobacteria bacterium]|nr:DUF1289 domain-containing protein [Pseudomonadota bacterium]